MNLHLKTSTFIAIVVIIAACKFKKNQDLSRIDPSIKYFADTSLPHIASGFYILTEDTTKGLRRKFYSFLKDDTIANKKVFGIDTSIFTSFKNIDSVSIHIFDRDLYNITLKLNHEGQRQFYYLTKQYNPDIAQEYLMGLQIGVIMNNTLVEIVHVRQVIDTNAIALFGAFNKETANDIKEQIITAIHRSNN
jgi:preprotein translocase subunit SecD